MTDTGGCACPGRAEGRHGLLCEHILRGAFGSVADAPQDVKQMLRDQGRLTDGTVVAGEIPASQVVPAVSVSFTASRTLTDEARDGVVTNVLTVRVPAAARYVTGACAGGDAFVGRWLRLHRPDAEHIVIVPADHSRVDPWWEQVGCPPVTVIEMPPGSTYADRNARLVAEADVVFAFPAYPENDPRSQRSGTWQTVRMSRRAGNFSQWHCVTPPYQGRIEVPPADLLTPAATKAATNGD